MTPFSSRAVPQNELKLFLKKHSFLYIFTFTRFFYFAAPLWKKQSSGIQNWWNTFFESITKNTWCSIWCLLSEPLKRYHVIERFLVLVFFTFCIIVTGYKISINKHLVERNLHRFLNDPSGMILNHCVSVWQSLVTYYWCQLERDMKKELSRTPGLRKEVHVY